MRLLLPVSLSSSSLPSFPICLCLCLLPCARKCGRSDERGVKTGHRRSSLDQSRRGRRQANSLSRSKAEGRIRRSFVPSLPMGTLHHPLSSLPCSLCPGPPEPEPEQRARAQASQNRKERGTETRSPDGIDNAVEQCAVEQRSDDDEGGVQGCRVSLPFALFNLAASLSSACCAASTHLTGSGVSPASCPAATQCASCLRRDDSVVVHAAARCATTRRSLPLQMQSVLAGLLMPACPAARRQGGRRWKVQRLLHGTEERLLTCCD